MSSWNTAEFLSIQAQDFIEDSFNEDDTRSYREFLSIQAQDFIEERLKMSCRLIRRYS